MTKLGGKKKYEKKEISRPSDSKRTWGGFGI